MQILHISVYSALYVAFLINKSNKLDSARDNFTSSRVSSQLYIVIAEPEPGFRLV